ncbi:MAG: phosphomannomutase/phosphoglucomutase [Proteobacteria bacterium]|jgi:phosphomannomutase / phosphoglucomutase|nr:phosphomannomutase/phosphoglucomutase [Pseudomonadota bacterium]
MNTTFPAEIFKAYDIRGIVDKSLTVELAHQIGQSIGTEAIINNQTAIVIGRDGRLSGPKLAKALADGIRDTGIEVVDIGVAPTPVIYFASYELGIPSCVAITGSHNPPDYNGFKMVIDGMTLSAERIQVIRQRIQNEELITVTSDKRGAYSSREIIPEYLRRIISDVKPARKIKLVIDCGNGVAGATAPQLFEQLGCEVTTLFGEVDGNFPNHHPDPSKLANLQDLIKAVKDQSAELGFAFDGDGDRLGVVTAQGKVIWPDRQMILFARDVLKRNPAAEIIYDVKCSRTLPREIEAAGGKATMWRTGHSFIKAKLKESGAQLAGEMSGHIFFKERWYGFDDGCYAGARLIELLSNIDQTPSEIFDELPDSVNTPELQIEMQEGEHYTFMNELIQNASFNHAHVSTMDGIRVDFDDGFGLIRPSNTTPTLVLRFEADDADALERIQSRFRALITDTRSDVIPPF